MFRIELEIDDILKIKSFRDTRLDDCLQNASIVTREAELLLNRLIEISSQMEAEDFSDDDESSEEELHQMKYDICTKYININKKFSEAVKTMTERFTEEI